MWKIRLFIPIILLIISLSNSFSQVKTGPITGSWMGKLDAGALSIRIIFNISATQNDSLVATMDSPDQGVKNLKMGTVTLEGSSLRIVNPLILGEYTGTIINDTLISGTWKQAGQSFQLDLTRLSDKFSLNRPQEPAPPLPYSEEEIIFRNKEAGIDLGGTLTIPEGRGPFRAVILISGSGAQNRDEELMGHKPFLVIADRLTRNNTVVLRFDDRGVGKSGGNPLTSTSADFATDVVAAFDILVSDPRIKSDSIGLVGHSEGGIIAPIVATSRKVAFIISLAGTGVPGDQIIFRQSSDISKASGISKEEIKKSYEANRILFSILKEEKDNILASEKMYEAYQKILDKDSIKPEDKEKALQQLKTSLNPQSLTWLRFFISTDPAIYWRKVKCPVLALNGENDLQVAADINLTAIEKALKAGGNRSVKTIKIPGLNHLFQHSETGLPAEYGNIEETFSEEVLKIMNDWIDSL